MFPWSRDWITLVTSRESLFAFQLRLSQVLKQYVLRFITY